MKPVELYTHLEVGKVYLSFKNISERKYFRIFSLRGEPFDYPSDEVDLEADETAIPVQEYLEIISFHGDLDVDMGYDDCYYVASDPNDQEHPTFWELTKEEFHTHITMEII